MGVVLLTSSLFVVIMMIVSRLQGEWSEFGRIMLFVGTWVLPYPVLLVVGYELSTGMGYDEDILLLLVLFFALCCAVTLLTSICIVVFRRGHALPYRLSLLTMILVPLVSGVAGILTGQYLASYPEVLRPLRASLFMEERGRSATILLPPLASRVEANSRDGHLILGSSLAIRDARKVG